jgi:hypothetical protein
MSNGHGGKRTGAGRPAGTKNEKTLEKAAARELVRQMITERLEPLLAAQIDNAVGIRHLIMRDPNTGKFERITNVEQIDEGLRTGAFWIYTKDPNVQAFTDLLNRCIDKPAEHVEVSGADGSPLEIRWQQRDEKPSDSDVKENPSPDTEKNGNG